MRNKRSRHLAPVVPTRLRGFGQVFRRYFITGLATLFPVTVTLWLVVFIFNFADGPLSEFLNLKFPGLGLLVTVVIILLVGFFSIHFGRVILRTMEGWVTRIPLVRHIYPAAKQVAQFLFNEKERPAGFLRVVLVQYPRSGIYSLAFVTNEAATTVTGSRRTLLTLLIPTPPSPLTGPIIFIPEEDVIPLTLSVEQAFKLVVSAGVVAPPLESAGT